MKTQNLSSLLAIGVIMLACKSNRLVSYQKKTDSIYLIENVSVFTGLIEKPVLEKVNVLVKEGVIEKISSLPIEKDNKTVINGEGKWLLPGFTDCHTHITAGVAIPWKIAMLPTMDFNFEACLYSGITTIIDMGGLPPKKISRISKAIESGKELGPRLIYCGIGFTVSGSHPFPFIEKIKKEVPFFLTPIVPKIGIAIDNKDDLKKIKKHLAANPDFTKVYIDEIPLGTPKMDLSILSEIVNYSHKANKPVLVHIGNNSDLKKIIDAGADGAAHIVYREKIDTLLVQQLKQKDMFVIPTIVVWDNYNKFINYKSTTHYTKLEWETIPDSRKAELKKGFPPTYAGKGAWPEWDKKLKNEYVNYLYPNLKELNNAGVKILAGTDSPSYGIAPGGSIHTELVHMVNAGLTPIEALMSATSVPANILKEKFHKDINFGTIEEGKCADLILVSGNPTINISDTQNIVEVFYKGKRLVRNCPK